MGVVKRTIALDHILDRYVRRLQAILVEKGYRATYSTALNYMLLYQIFDLMHRKIHPEVAQALQSFMAGRKTHKQIQRADTMTEYLEHSRKRIKARYIT